MYKKITLTCFFSSRGGVNGKTLPGGSSGEGDGAATKRRSITSKEERPEGKGEEDEGKEAVGAHPVPP